MFTSLQPLVFSPTTRYDLCVHDSFHLEDSNSKSSFNRWYMKWSACIICLLPLFWYSLSPNCFLGMLLAWVIIAQSFSLRFFSLRGGALLFCSPAHCILRVSHSTWRCLETQPLTHTISLLRDEDIGFRDLQHP